MDLQEMVWRMWSMDWNCMSKDREKLQAFVNEANKFLAS